VDPVTDALIDVTDALIGVTDARIELPTHKFLLPTRGFAYRDADRVTGAWICAAGREIEREEWLIKTNMT